MFTHPTHSNYPTEICFYQLDPSTPIYQARLQSLDSDFETAIVIDDRTGEIITFELPKEDPYDNWPRLWTEFSFEIYKK